MAKWVGKKHNVNGNRDVTKLGSVNLSVVVIHLVKMKDSNDFMKF